ncbi:hypothetical protein L1049_003981 [Liquidambar formosana]|uniref:Uncharacterized protein n=1 Tax=Liquidambar formosana TaxID=63359 RepID=A0AAP0RNC0_LIQFO
MVFGTSPNPVLACLPRSLPPLVGLESKIRDYIRFKSHISSSSIRHQASSIKHHTLGFEGCRSLISSGSYLNHYYRRNGSSMISCYEGTSNLRALAVLKLEDVLRN